MTAELTESIREELNKKNYMQRLKSSLYNMTSVSELISSYIKTVRKHFLYNEKNNS